MVNGSSSEFYCYPHKRENIFAILMLTSLDSRVQLFYCLYKLVTLPLEVFFNFVNFVFNAEHF